MRPFPENYELEAFFEKEPFVLDESIPWAYNELTFDAVAENGILHVKIAAGYEEMDIVWTQQNNTVLKLKLRGVQSLLVSDEKTCNTLIASFRSHDVSDLKIKIRPVISLEWGYDDQNRSTL